MERIAVITHLPLWHPGAGDRARVRAMVKFLSQFAEVLVIIVERPTAWKLDDWKETKLFKTYMEEYPAVHAIMASDKELLRSLSRTLLERKIEAAIFIHAPLYKLLPAVPANVLTAVDTIDLISERSQSLKSIDGTEKPHVSLKDELKILEKFDLIILIKDDDLSKVSENFDSNRLVLAPHPVDFPKRNIRDQPRIVGFIGSRYGPNISSMNDFIQDVWPSVQDLGMQLNIYGDVGVSIDPPTDQTVNIRGFVESDDTIYDEIDIVVNPVQQGAGFKIKTIEALGNGLPLISTRHSVMGLPEEKEEYYLMAENAEDFQKHLRRLHGSIDERIRLGDEAYRVASNHFSPKACFTQLLQCLNRR